MLNGNNWQIMNKLMKKTYHLDYLGWNHARDDSEHGDDSLNLVTIAGHFVIIVTYQVKEAVNFIAWFFITEK